ncbi:MAG TPA: 1-phosphofructokinase family hexose kinase [Gaiellaceae bacterium]|nr:1-phosphofructokinase family hexose kinase [Gaiellaceae bacterium]
MIVTVTMNAALDRTLTVPNFQRGQRHRASDKLTLAGGKGITVARALKTLGVPVVATGLAGGRNGRRILEELAEEAILADFVRIEDESRTSTAVADPTSGTFTEVLEWGPFVQESELEVLLEKLDYLARGAELVVFAGTLPRGVSDEFYAEAIRALGRRGVFTVLDAEGEPLRVGLDAEPFLVSPNRVEAEAVVGQEFSEDGDFLDALERLEDLGARNALITDERGCFASVRGERGQRKRFRAEGPAVEAVSGVGSGAVLLAGFIAAWLEDAPPEEALRRAVAAGAASTLTVGAGRFHPDDMGRLLPDVHVAELSAASV